VVFFEGGDLPLGDGLQQDIVKYVRLCQGRVVVHIRPEEAVLRRNFLVDSNGEIIFVYDLLTYKFVYFLIPLLPGRTSVGRWKKGRYFAILSSTQTDACVGARFVECVPGTAFGSCGHGPDWHATTGGPDPARRLDCHFCRGGSPAVLARISS